MICFSETPCEYVSLFLSLIYIYIYIYIYTVIGWKLKTWLSRHYKFISTENITILSVSSDDFLHAFLEVTEQQM